MDDTTLRITQWRKRLERNGWTGIRRATPPHSDLIEYHVVWRGHLVSGRMSRMGCGEWPRIRPGAQGRFTGDCRCEESRLR